MLSSKSLICSFLVTVLVLIIGGCQSDQPVEPEYVPRDKLLKSMGTDSTSHLVFQYDSGRLIRYEDYKNSEVDISIEFTYDSLGRIATEEVILKSPYSYHYFNVYKYNTDDNNILVELNSKSDEGKLTPSGFIKHYRNASNRVEKIERYYTLGKPGYTEEYTYNPQGNIEETRIYEQQELHQVERYTYDDKKNPLKVFQSSIYWRLPLNGNNIISITREIYGSTPATETVTISYTYDADNYPVQSNTEYNSTLRDKSYHQSAYIYE